MKIICILVLCLFTLAQIQPAVTSDRRGNNNNREKNRNEERRDRDNEREKKEREEQDKWKDARKEIADYVRDIKNEVKDTISSAVLDRLQDRLDKQKKQESSESSRESRQDRRRYQNIESALTKEIENLAKEVKSKIVDRVMKKKEFIQSNIQDKLKLIGQALQSIRPENKEDDDHLDTTDKPESDKEKEILKEITKELDSAIEAVLLNEVNGTTEPSSSANTAVVRLLLHKMLKEIQSDIDQVKSSWMSFIDAEKVMKEKARQLHETEVVDGKTRSSFTFEKLNTFRASLRNMLERKKNFVAEKIELKHKVLSTLHNMSLLHRARTGREFSYVEFLESVLNGTIKLPKILSDLMEDIQGVVEDIKEEQVEAVVEEVATETPEPAVESDQTTTAAEVYVVTNADETAEESVVLDVLEKVQELESNLANQISTLENQAKAKFLEQVQIIREVIANLNLDPNENDNPVSLSNVTSEEPFIADVIHKALTSTIAGNVSEVNLAGSSAILNLLVENLLKEFSPSIQRLRQWRLEFQRVRESLMAIADGLQRAVDEAVDVSNVTIDLTEYSSRLQEIHNVKALFLSEKSRVTSRVLEALERMSALYQNRTGSELSYTDVLNSLQNSTVDLTPLLDDFYSDLSTVAHAEGLKLDVVDPDASSSKGESPTSSIIGVAVVGTVVVVLAALGFGFYAFKRQKRQRLYTRI